MKLPKIFESKLFLSAALIVLLGVFALELQQWQQRRKIDLEISHLKQEQADLQARNNALQQSLQYFSSDNYKEKLAREQLGLKKEGEIVVNFPANGVQGKDQQAQNQPTNNFQKWWQYIFNNKKT
ncbi:MAG TPA: septum formation initiator family protein [Patescibacteria group bacterium]|jgi:cell division protein DivIC|nr:septum formation initiator family protein [Patescibacteria group bacterium]